MRAGETLPCAPTTAARGGCERKRDEGPLCYFGDEFEIEQELQQQPKDSPDSCMQRRWGTSPPRRSSSSRGERTSTSLLRALNGRSATGSPRGVELWAEDESVLRQQLEYLDLSAAATVHGTGPTKSTIAVAFSTDG